MGTLQKIKTRLSSVWRGESQPPVIQTLNWPFAFFQETKQGNFYRIYNAMTEVDADLYGYLNRISHMCKQSFADVTIDAGRTLEPDEEELRDIGREIARKLEFKSEFYSTAFDLMRHGDVIKHMVWDVDNGVTKLETLPRTDLTAVGKKEQVGTYNTQIFNDNFFVINERQADKTKVHPADTCIKFPLNDRSTIVTDLMGRTTYGVWSMSPCQPLLYFEEWKVNTMINDILWSHRNVPREWHKLDLSEFSPDKYQGTREERERQAYAAATTAANKYAQSLQARAVDVGVVTDKGTDISYLEPKSTNYQAPNKKLAQINEALSNAMGLPPVARDTSFASSLMSGSFAILQALSIADIVKTGFEKAMRKSIFIQYGERYKDLLPKLKIRLKLILEKDKSEIMRQIAIMVESRCFTPTEIRDEWGLEPLTDDQWAEIYEMVKMGESARGTSTIAETVEDARRGKRIWPIYPSEKSLVKREK